MRVAIVTDVGSHADPTAAIQACADAAYALNVRHLLTHPETPPLYCANVVYQREPLGRGEERFDTVPVVLSQGWGDCDDLAPWRAAELTIAGIPSRPLVRRLGGRHWHVVVTDRYGRVEDPSRVLGMGCEVCHGLAQQQFQRRIT